MSIEDKIAFYEELIEERELQQRQGNTYASDLRKSCYNLLFVEELAGSLICDYTHPDIYGVDQEEWDKMRAWPDDKKARAICALGMAAREAKAYAAGLEAGLLKSHTTSLTTASASTPAGAPTA